MGSSGGLVCALGPGTPLTRLGLCRLSVEFLAVTNVPLRGDRVIAQISAPTLTMVNWGAQ